MQRLHRDLGRFLKSQQHGIARASTEFTRETFTQQRTPILRRLHACHTIEIPEPFVNSVNLYRSCPAFARLVNHDTVKRDQGTSLSILREIDRQLFSEESDRRNQLLCLTEAPQRQVSKTPTHGLADQQRACKHGN